jgi:hypothetical protein
MQTRPCQVTVRVTYEEEGVRAEAVLADDRAFLVGTGWVGHSQINPFPAPEDRAVAVALHDVARQLAPAG